MLKYICLDLLDATMRFLNTLCVLFVSLLPWNTFADTNLIRNADFENNFAGGTLEDTTNMQFNVRMNLLEAFGDKEGIDIYTTGSFSEPQSGDWNIALRADAGGDTEAFSFPLKGQLDPDEEYKLEFYIKPLLSLTHAGGSIEIGMSSDPDDFGTQIFTADTAGIMSWQKVETTFEANFNKGFITVRVDNSDNHWVAIDNFRLTHARGDLLLNGSFEDNANDDTFIEAVELTNLEYNEFMSNSESFGADGFSAIANLIGEFPNNGNWKIVGGGMGIPKGQVQELSLKLVEPIDPLQPHYLEFFFERINMFQPDTGGVVRVGLSNSPNSFGLLLFESPVATLGWDRTGTTFLPVISANYLTVQIEVPDVEYVAVDDFSLRPFLLGDINFDGSVDLLDVEPFVAIVSSGDFLAEADANSNGAVDLLDVDAFVDLLIN